MKTAEFLMWLILAIFTAAIFCGCNPPALADFDREYVGAYDATSGQGGVKVRWSPAAEKGKGRPTVGLDVSFKNVQEPELR